VRAAGVSGGGGCVVGDGVGAGEVVADTTGCSAGRGLVPVVGESGVEIAGRIAGVGGG
jgi:hypothetical protein